MAQRTAAISSMLTAACLALAGCSSQTKTVESTPTPDYSRQLGPGESALRLVTDPARMPDLGSAWDRYRQYESFLRDASEESLAWFSAPSSHQFYPFQGISHEQARASVQAMGEVLADAPTRQAFVDEAQRLFDVYESVGYDGDGTVLFTGYYAPVFNASRTRTPRFQHPLFRRPADLVTDPVTGEPRGRRTTSGGVVPYFTRREIEESGMFAGNELVWLEDALSAYIVQVNGSAKLRMTDGASLYVGYAGKTDLPYTGLGRSMIDEGLIAPERLSLPAIEAYHRDHPDTVLSLIHRNENYVFFTEYDESKWPSGSLGVRVTEEASLATDKKIYPRGGFVLVNTQAISVSGQRRHFLQFMLDQDTGGAIKAPGRADIYMGKGPTAQILAGGQYAEGRLYYFFLKPEFVAGYSESGVGAEFADVMPVE